MQWRQLMNLFRAIFKSRDRPKNHTGDSIGGGRYFADFGYHIRTYGLHDPTEEDYRMRLLIREENGTLLAEQMYLS